MLELRSVGCPGLCGAGACDGSWESRGKQHGLQISAIPTGFGSSVNGGELLFLALATCYVNDIYREAGKRNIPVSKVEVEVSGDFGAEGEPARMANPVMLRTANGVRL